MIEKTPAALWLDQSKSSPRKEGKRGGSDDEMGGNDGMGEMGGDDG